MPRVSDALERARATNREGSQGTWPRPGEGHRAFADVPASWHFEDDERDRAATEEDRLSPVEVPETWELDESREVGVPTAEAFAANLDSELELDPDEAEDPRDQRDQGEVVGSEQIPADEVVGAPAEEPGSLRFDSVDAEKLVVGFSADALLVEQYRSLGASLHHAQTQSDMRIVLVTSAVEAEGKTLTATNLSLTLSQSYQKRVLLLDADLRRPSVHELLQLDNRAGLGNVLKEASAQGKLPVQRLSPTLWVMTAGHPNRDPMSSLVSDNMKQLLVEASKEFDWIVMDSPPVAMLPDASLLAAMADTTLLVVKAGTTPYPLVARAIESIGRERILGTVLNRAVPSDEPGGYHDYSYAPSGGVE